MPSELSVRKGQVWAFREKPSLPLVPVQIVNQPAHYEASITIRKQDYPASGLLSVRRAKLPCKWEDVDAYLDAHPNIPREPPPPREPVEVNREWEPIADAASDPLATSEATIRRIVREELERTISVPRLALNYEDAAKATGYSATALRLAVQWGNLVPSYTNSKPVFPVEELKRWLKSSPNEPPQSRW